MAAYGLPGDQAGRFGLGGDFGVTESGQIFASSFVDGGTFDNSTFHVLSPTADGASWAEFPEPFGILDQDAMSGGGEISSDAAHLMVGAWKDSNPNFFSGAVYFYELDTFNYLGDPAVNANFNVETSVACDGTTYAVGLPSDNDAANGTGAVLIYDTIQGAGALVQKILPPTTAASQGFGARVLLAGDTLIATAANTTEVHLFLRQGDGSFAFRQTISPPPSVFGFGQEIAAEDISPRKTLAVSATGSGSVFVYHLNPTTGFWGEQTELTGSSADEWGRSVAASGDVVIVGAPATNQGAGQVTVFRWNGAAYESEGVPNLFIQGILATDFGREVALGSDWLAISSSREGNSTFLHFYEATDGNTLGFENGNSPVLQNATNITLSGAGKRLIAGVPGDNETIFGAGRIEIFEQQDDGAFQRIRSHFGNTQNQNLGRSVAICEDLAIVGSLYSGFGNQNAFSLFRFNTPLISNWAARFNLLGFEALPGADPNGDGVDNLMAYALGLDPINGTPQENAERLPKITENTNQSEPTIQFIVPSPISEGIIYKVQFGCDLENWETIATNEGFGWTQEGAFVTVESLAPRPLNRVSVWRMAQAQEEGCYYRLQVEVK